MLKNDLGPPLSNFINVLQTDFYQITMCYAYWKAGIHDVQVTFEAFFRTCPFGGEFLVFAGLDEVNRLVNKFQFTEPQIAYCLEQVGEVEEEFVDYLRSIDGSSLSVTAVEEGTFVFPHEPLACCQSSPTSFTSR
eukprot:Trichotokara_eunicae@DN741_c0_g1_i1.p1